MPIHIPNLINHIVILPRIRLQSIYTINIYISINDLLSWKDQTFTMDFHGFPWKKLPQSVSKSGLGGFWLTFPCHGLCLCDGDRDLRGRGVGGAALWLAFLGKATGK